MASADEYAAWIVANQDKKGTPDFEMVANAYQEAKKSTVPEGMMQVGSRQPTFVSDSPTSAARMLFQPKTTRLVPTTGPIDRAIFEAGGSVTEIAAKAGLPAEVAAGAGYLTNLGLQAGSTFVGGMGGAKAGPLLESGGKWLMQSALKPGRAAIDTGKAERAVTTLLDEGINATRGGAEILRDKVNVLQSEVSDILGRHPEAVVDKQRVYDALAASVDKAMLQGTPQSDLVTLRKAIMNFAQHPLLKDAEAIPVQLAQEIKQGVWRKLGERSFGKGLVPEAARDAQKAIGSGLRRGIEDVAPEVGPLNAKSAEFLNAMKLVEKRAGIEGNKNIIGLGTLSPSLESFIIWMLDRYPAGKSILARMLYSGSKSIPATIGGTTAAALAVQSGKPREGL